MEKFIFKMKSFFIITYSKPFKDFENEYFQKTPEIFLSMVKENLQTKKKIISR